ncbi:hypothetical protein KR054_006360, partial [Drosophila jambulina]
CRPKAGLVALDSNQKDTIVTTVNKFRNRTAAGLTEKLQPAGRMARIEWSKELEHFAMMDVLSCEPTRPCMTSPNFPNMGRIFDTFSYLGKQHDSVELIIEMILRWFNEGAYVTPKQTVLLNDNIELSCVNQLFYLNQNLIFFFIFHRSVLRATLLMSERNTHMGCSAHKLKYHRFRYMFLSCTFATTNILGAPIYRSAKTPGQLCRKQDAVFKNLCAVGERYRENSKLVNLTRF